MGRAPRRWRGGGGGDDHDDHAGRNGFSTAVTMGISAVLTTLAVALALGFFLLVEANRPGPSGEKIVVIARGAGVSTIGTHLQEEGVIRSASVFRLAAEVYGRDGLKAGEYEIPARASLADVLRALASGKVLFHGVTIPEGATSAAAMELVRANAVLTGETPPPPPEGAILPETYTVERGMTRAELVAQMLAARERLLLELWANRAKDLPFQTPEEALILASIVEKETGLAAERPQVAAVFVNRLRKSMRLESDPTIIYGLTRGVPLGRGLRRSEIDQRTSYNTYQIPGLPPGPISNPGRAAIEAVLNPPTSDALFFVADGTGGHAFAATYKEHERNVAKWREVERQRAAQAALAGNPSR